MKNYEIVLLVLFPVIYAAVKLLSLYYHSAFRRNERRAALIYQLFE